MPVDSVEENTEPTFGIVGILSSVFRIFQHCKYGVNVSMGILKYPMSLQFFDIPTQD